MNFRDRLRNTLLDIKFGQQPGVHRSGRPRKVLTVEEALDEVALRMGIGRVSLKPLYEVDWNERKLKSRVTGHKYWIDQLQGSGEYVVKYHGTWIGGWESPEAAIDAIAHREREDNYEYAF